MKSASASIIFRLSLAAAAAFDVGAANAADWQWDPRVDIAGNYDTNYGLNSGNAENTSVAGSSLDLSLRASYMDPNTKFDITPRAQAIYYPGQSEFDSNNFFLDSNFEHLWQRANFSVNEMFWSQDVLRSYLPTTAIGTALGQTSAGADLADINQRIRQDLLVLTPTATFDLSPREHLVVQAQYLDVNYSEAIQGEIQNFQSFTGSVGLGFAVTPQSTVTVSGNASDLKPATGSGATTYGGQGQWDTHLSERMQAYAKLGLEHTSFDLAQYGKSSATSVSGGLGISRKFVTYDLFADFARSVSPDSAGDVVVRNDLRLRLEHKFSGRTSGYVGLRAIDQSALGNSVTFIGQRYGQGAIGVEWRIYRQFSIISEYAYTSLKESNTPQSPGSNAVTITLRYEPHRPVEEFGVNIGR
jgi:hypothetical protein